MLKKFLKKSIKSIKKIKDEAEFIMKPIKIQNSKFKRPYLAGVTVEKHINNIDPWVSELILKLPLNPHGVFIDVGANLGQTLLSIKAVFPDSIYIGFEVNFRCCLYLEKLVNKNNLVNSHVLPIGCADTAKVAPLWIKGTVSPGATLKSEVKDVSNRKIIHVPIFMLDEAIATVAENYDHLNFVQFMKIDVEGYEPEVLIGAHNIIVKNRPLILTEVFPPRYEDDKARLDNIQKLQSFIEEYDYSVYGINYTTDYKLLGLILMNNFPVDIRKKGQFGYSRDYLLVPNERNSIIISCKGLNIAKG